MNYKFISLPKIYKYLNGNEWLLFTVLFDEWQLMKNEEGYFFRSWNSLKEDTGLSNNGLNSALKGLIKKKFISKKTYEKKTQKSNDYRIEADYISSLTPTLNREKATLKKGEGYSQKRSTSKEERTKEKINNNRMEIVNNSARTHIRTREEEEISKDEVYRRFGENMKRGNYLITCLRDAVTLDELKRIGKSFDDLIVKFNLDSGRHSEKQKKSATDLDDRFVEAYNKKIEEIRMNDAKLLKEFM